VCSTSIRIKLRGEAMHEMALTENLVEIAVEEARRQAA
jgi:hypothetical protein